MVRSFSLFTVLGIFVYAANMLVISDNKGNILHQNKIVHTKNDFINQKATEYSQQAIYNELHRQEYLALLAGAAKEHLEHIAQETKAAQQRGETYKLSAADQTKLLEDAKYFKGGRYVWGGVTPSGFDCSGYVRYIFNKYDIKLPRTALEQSKTGEEIRLTEAKTGDLLFFNTDKKRGIPISHVGIYMGNGQFIHAASQKRGIMISPLKGYYESVFVLAKRMIKPSDKMTKIASAL